MIRNKFGSVLSRNIELASDFEEVEFFEFPKENLPKESLARSFSALNFYSEISSKTRFRPFSFLLFFYVSISSN